jgi:Ca2+-binding RTX toxin-like protein
LGNDSLAEASGNDTYRFADGWGVDTLDGVGGGVDTLDFSAVSSRVNVSLVQRAGTSEASSGTSTLNITNTDAIIENARGGTNNDTLLGNNFTNVLVGNAGTDLLAGHEQSDTLLGGSGAEFLDGGVGDDQLNGGEGNDSYDFTVPFWDNDTIIDTAVADSDLNTSNQVYVGSSVSDNLTINLVSSSTTSEMHYTGFPAGLDTVEWSNSVIDRISNNGSGNDNISGNASPNHIFSHNGNDTISAGDGDDFIDVQDRAGLDQVNCGGGIDTVKIDSGDELNNDCVFQ